MKKRSRALSRHRGQCTHTNCAAVTHAWRGEFRSRQRDANASACRPLEMSHRGLSGMKKTWAITKTAGSAADPSIYRGLCKYPITRSAQYGTHQPPVESNNPSWVSNVEERQICDGSQHLQKCQNSRIGHQRECLRFQRQSRLACSERQFVRQNGGTKNAPLHDQRSSNVGGCTLGSIHRDLQSYPRQFQSNTHRR
jgi:hypothetical protein